MILVGSTGARYSRLGRVEPRAADRAAMRVAVEPAPAGRPVDLHAHTSLGHDWIQYAIRRRIAVKEDIR